MKATVYGYIRVSTKEQNEARQLHAMQEFGIAAENMVVEKQSGKDFQRPYYRDLVSRLRPGDVLVVKSIDRLGRNYSEILEELRHRAAASQLCGGDGAAEHPPAAG